MNDDRKEKRGKARAGIRAPRRSSLRLMAPFLFSLFSFHSLPAQTENVQKNPSTNRLTESLVIPSGITLSIESGGTIANSGTATGFTATPGGSTGQVQYNSSGTLAGATGITFSGGAVTAITSGAWNATAIAVLYGGTGATTAADARTNLGLAIGTNVQAYDADLTTWAGVTPAAGIATFLATPSSANLAAALTDETGTGALVFATSPTITTPSISGAVSFPDNVRQTFNPGTDVAGLNVGGVVSSPISAIDGDIWYDTAQEHFHFRQGGAILEVESDSYLDNMIPFTHSISSDYFNIGVGSLRANFFYSRTDNAGTAMATGGIVFFTDADGAGGAAPKKGYLLPPNPVTTDGMSWTLPSAGTTITLIGSGDSNTVTATMLASTLDLGGKTSFEIPNSAAPTVDAFGELAGDDNLWATSRGAPVFYDGTASVALVGVLTSDTPSDGQYPRWNTGGTITWETVSTGLTVGTTAIASGTAGRVLYETAGNVLGGITGATSDGTTLTLVAPVLGTPASGTLTNCTGLPASGVVGTAAILGSNTFTGAQTLSVNGAASTPALHLTGAITTGGTGTTNVPNVFIQPTAATVATSWSTSGTALGINLDQAAGNFVDFRTDGAVRFSIEHDGDINVGTSGTIITSAGTYKCQGDGGGAALATTGLFMANATPVKWSSTSAWSGTADTFLTRGGAAATVEMGEDTNGDAVDQTLKAADGITGTDRNGGDLNLKSGNSTGSGTSAIIFSTPEVGGGSGVTARTASERARISGSGLTIGSGGAAIAKILTATATLDFPNTVPESSEEMTVTVTGAADGDAVVIGVPNGSATSGGTFFGYVSASNTVTIRFLNNEPNGGGDINPASGTFRVTVIQH